MKKSLIIVVLLSSYIVSCNQNSSFDEEKYITLGKEIGQITGKTLATQLKKTIKEQGAIEAISFCNLKAYPLTDSLSQIHQVVIKRVATKFRNHNNQANQQEERIIQEYINLLSQNKDLSPVIERENGIIHFYAPIKVQKACLKCHGTLGTEVSDSLYNHIKNLYPKDLAIDFKEGDIRGVWNINFKEK